MREHVLARHVLDKGWTKGAELGLWRGRTFLHLLETCPHLTMIGVDAWKKRPKNEGDGQETYETWDMEKFESDVRESAEKYGNRAIIKKMETLEAANEVEDGLLDFVFIDADHSYEGVKNDIEAWLPKIRKGGILFGHDIDWPTVKKAVEEKFDYTIEEDNVWYTSVA